jgi:hypothetical protein
MSLDFNNYGPPKDFDLIPDGTIATVRMTVRSGNAGEGGWLRRSQDGLSEALDCEFVVLDGPFVKRKIWTLFTINGTTDGHAKAKDISGGKLRSILESARGIRSDDTSDTAKEARRTTSYADFNGLTFIARIAVERGKNGYKDKAVLGRAITPDEKAWHPVTQEPQRVAASPASAKAASTPAHIEPPVWARTKK